MKYEHTPDAIRLREWIEAISQEYYDSEKSKGSSNSAEGRKERQDIERLRGILSGKMPRQSALRTMRMLIATGIFKFGTTVSDTPPETKIPDIVVLEFMLSALWPIVTAPNLPDEWFIACQEIASTEISRLLLRMRHMRDVRGENLVFDEFTQEIQNPKYNAGMMNLLEDLSDLRRGAFAFAALTKISPEGTFKDKVPKASEALKWVLAGAAAGIVGNRADSAGLEIWDWMKSDSSQSNGNANSLANHAGGSDHGGDLSGSDNLGSENSGHGSGQAASPNLVSTHKQATSNSSSSYNILDYLSGCLHRTMMFVLAVVFVVSLAKIMLA